MRIDRCVVHESLQQEILEKNLYPSRPDGWVTACETWSFCKQTTLLALTPFSPPYEITKVDVSTSTHELAHVGKNLTLTFLRERPSSSNDLPDAVYDLAFRTQTQQQQFMNSWEFKTFFRTW